VQKTYVALTPVNFADHDFFVRVGDILVHDISNNNRLTVYRNGEIVKTLSQTALCIAAMVKSGFIQDTTGMKSPPPEVEASAPKVQKREPKIKEVRVEAPKPEIKPVATVAAIPAPPKEKAATESPAK
jgi:hypothetical protein